MSDCWCLVVNHMLHITHVARTYHVVHSSHLPLLLLVVGALTRYSRTEERKATIHDTKHNND